LHIQPYYRDRYGFQPDDYPVAYRNYLRLVTLPLNQRMTDSDIEDVVEAVGDVIKRHRR
jgi:dTDP-4-amino-4,6-dideoxygalactose transaminase